MTALDSIEIIADAPCLRGRIRTRHPAAKDKQCRPFGRGPFPREATSKTMPATHHLIHIRAAKHTARRVCCPPTLLPTYTIEAAHRANAAHQRGNMIVISKRRCCRPVRQPSAGWHPKSEFSPNPITVLHKASKLQAGSPKLRLRECTLQPRQDNGEMEKEEEESA